MILMGKLIRPLRKVRNPSAARARPASFELPKEYGMRMAWVHRMHQTGRISKSDVRMVNKFVQAFSVKNKRVPSPAELLRVFPKLGKAPSRD